MVEQKLQAIDAHRVDLIGTQWSQHVQQFTVLLQDQAEENEGYGRERMASDDIISQSWAGRAWMVAWIDGARYVSTPRAAD